MLNYNRKWYWWVIHTQKKNTTVLINKHYVNQTCYTFIRLYVISYMYETRNISLELHGMQFIIHWYKEMPYDMNTIYMYHALCVGSKFILWLKVAKRRMWNIDNYYENAVIVKVLLRSDSGWLRYTYLQFVIENGWPKIIQENLCRQKWNKAVACAHFVSISFLY